MSASLSAEDVAFLADFHDDCNNEVYGGELCTREVGAGDFARWLQLRSQEPEKCGERITRFDVLSALDFLEAWVKQPFNGGASDGYPNYTI